MVSRIKKNTGGRKMIVKVQLSLATSANVQQVLVYSEDRKISWEGDASREIIRRMKGEPKAFFYAHIKNKVILLDDLAKWQEW